MYDIFEGDVWQLNMENVVALAAHKLCPSRPLVENLAASAEVRLPHGSVGKESLVGVLFGLLDRQQSHELVLCKLNWLSR